MDDDSIKQKRFSKAPRLSLLQCPAFRGCIASLRFSPFRNGSAAATIWRSIFFFLAVFAFFFASEKNLFSQNAFPQNQGANSEIKIQPISDSQNQKEKSSAFQSNSESQNQQNFNSQNQGNLQSQNPDKNLSDFDFYSEKLYEDLSSLSLTEKIDPDELEPFYIDEDETKLILKLFDGKFRTIKKAGGIAVPETEYAQNQVRKFIAQYMTKRGSENLSEILKNAENYRLFIRKELEKRKMPKALEYLPVVESEYKISAKSRSGALGMWQFMENSISPFMKKNEWIDERLDPWISTKAALSKLQDNYKMFNDWAIAIAAYNCGAGAMRKILASAEEKSFWFIAEKGLLRDESVNYIPKLIAITEISEHPERYNLFLPEISKYAGLYYDNFDYVELENQADLHALSLELRLDFDELKRLNNSLVQDKTPPKTFLAGKKYKLRLPSGLAETFYEIFGKEF